jgi:hypothetical protein
MEKPTMPATPPKFKKIREPIPIAIPPKTDIKKLLKKFMRDPPLLLLSNSIVVN